MMYLDFQTAFDKVLQRTLVMKVRADRIRGLKACH